MYDMPRIVAAVVFVVLWYALTLIGRALFKPYEKLKLVWCPHVRSLSFVEAQAISAKGSAPSVSVRHCLLWREHENCQERCVK